MKLDLRFDVQPLLAKLQGVRRDVVDKGVVSALNKAAAQGRTEMSRAIRDEFNVSATTVREKLFVSQARRVAGAVQIQATLLSKTPGGKRRAINLINFAARKTAKGLTVKIKRSGGRVIAARDGFIGNKGRTAFVRVPGTVMNARRGSIGQAHRQKIKPLQTIDVPQMFNTRRINARVRRKLAEILPSLVEREVAFQLTRAGLKR